MVLEEEQKGSKPNRMLYKKSFRFYVGDEGPDG